MADITDPTELWNTIRAMQAEIEELKLRSVSFDSASQVMNSISDLDYRAVDPNGVLRMIISAVNLINEIGVSAFLAALSAAGIPTAWIDADNGKITSGGGSLTMGDDGLISKGVPIVFENNYAPLIQNHFSLSDLLYSIRGYINASYEKLQTSNNPELVTDGGFELGTWLPNFGTYSIVEHDGGQALQMDIGAFAQQLLNITTADETGLYVLEADVLGYVSMSIVNNGWPDGYIGDPPTSGWVFQHNNTYTAWTRIRFLFSVDFIPLLVFGNGDYALRLVCDNGGGSYDNISIKKVYRGIGMGINESEVRVFGLAHHNGNIFESGLAYTMPVTTNAITAVTLTANRQYLMPFFVNREIVVSDLQINVSTLAAAKTAQVAIYKDTTGMTTTLNPVRLNFMQLMQVSGAVSVATIGVKTFAMNARLQPGMYYFGLQSNGAPIVAGAAVTASIPNQGYTVIPSTRVTCKYRDVTYGSWGYWQSGANWLNLTTTNPLIWAKIA